MQTPLQVMYRQVRSSDAVDAYLRRKAEKLDTHCDRIIACRVVVEAPHRHRSHNRPYRVRIDISVPGGHVLVSHPHEIDPRNVDLYAAIDNAFDEAIRRLEVHMRRRWRD